MTVFEWVCPFLSYALSKFSWTLMKIFQHLWQTLSEPLQTFQPQNHLCHLTFLLFKHLWQTDNKASYLKSIYIGKLVHFLSDSELCWSGPQTHQCGSGPFGFGQIWTTSFRMICEIQIGQNNLQNSDCSKLCKGPCSVKSIAMYFLIEFSSYKCQIWAVL